MIRLVLALLFLVLFFVLTVPYLLIQKLIERKDPERAKDSCSAAIRWAMRVLLVLTGTKLTVEGADRVPEGSVLYVGNHRSFFDFVTSFTVIPGRLCYIGKKELTRVPIFRHWLPMVRSLMLDRKDLKQGLKVILEAIAYIKAGVPVFIFPEGTRSRSEDQSELLEFHEGSLKPAVKTGCPIVPVAFFHTADILEAHFPMIRSTAVRMIFLDPVRIEDIPEEMRKKPGAYVRGLLQDALREQGKEQTHG